MNEVLGELIAFSLAVAINPIPIIAILLTFQSPDSRRLSTAFGTGWVLGVSILVVAFFALSSRLPAQDPHDSSPVLGIIYVVIGLLLVALSFWKWRKRPAKGEDPSIPGWMTSVTTMRISRGFGLGFLISFLNIKHILIAGSAGATIATAKLSGLQTVIAILFFLMLATSSATVPIIAFLSAGEGFNRRMQGVHDWLVVNNATILSVLLFVIGVVIFGDGIQAF